jgi:hypothetical protein
VGTQDAAGIELEGTTTYQSGMRKHILLQKYKLIKQQLMDFEKPTL